MFRSYGMSGAKCLVNQVRNHPAQALLPFSIEALRSDKGIVIQIDSGPHISNIRIH